MRDNRADATEGTQTNEERLLMQRILKSRARARRNGAIGATMTCAGVVLLTFAGLTFLRSAYSRNTEQITMGLSAGLAGGLFLSLGAVPLALQGHQIEEHDTLLRRMNLATKERIEREVPDVMEELARSV